MDYHEPVLLKEVIEALNVKRNCWYLDVTLGDGGHSLKILKIGGNIVGVEVDPQALERANRRLEKEGFDRDSWKLVRGNFRDIKDLVRDKRFAGVLFDLGVSSLQFNVSERGFSFSREGPLDMRMDPNLAVKAEDLIAGLNKGELYELFNKLGEEGFARAVSSALVSAREVGIRTTKDLADLVEKVYRQHGISRWRIHPATKVFQALRIAVNDELNALREALPQALGILSEGGRIVVISFHSLEDRIVKQTFKDWEESGLGIAVTKKPISPSENEIMKNPRSRSAKLRVFKKYDHNTQI